MARRKPITTYNGVGDRPTPATDQLFAVRVTGYDDELQRDTSSAATHKYYVPANSIVVGKNEKSMVHRNGPKRRAVNNPVYEVTADFVDMREHVDRGTVRVFGVAYDGIGTGGAALAPEHRDALGRFSVIFTGVATIGCPKSDSNTDCRMGYYDAHIGDIVLTNVFDEPQYNMTGDPDAFRPFAMGVCTRSTFARFTADPLADNNAEQVLAEAFGDNSRALFIREGDREVKAVAATLARRVMYVMTGYVLDTAGDYRAEIRVQLALNYGHIAQRITPIECVNQMLSEINFDRELSPEVQETMVNFVRRLNERQAAGGTLFGREMPGRNDTGFLALDPDDVATNPYGLASAFIDTVKTALDAAPVAAPTEDPRSSMAGVLGAAAAPNVGSIDYETTQPHEAGAVLAAAPSTQVGFGHDNTIVPGTFADELLAEHPADPASATKLQDRHALVKALASDDAPPDSVGSQSADDAMVLISTAHETPLASVPAAVRASHNWHSTDGTVTVANPVFAHVATSSGDLITTPAAGTRIDIYADDSDDTRTRANEFKRAIHLAAKSGKAIHAAPPEHVAAVVEAARNVARS